MNGTILSQFAALVPEQQIGVILLALVAIYGACWIAGIVRQALRKRQHAAEAERLEILRRACIDIRAYRMRLHR